MHSSTWNCLADFDDSGDVAGGGMLWRTAIRKRYQTPKHAAAAFRVAVSTAEGWFAGRSAPQFRHLRAAVRMHPEIGPELLAPGSEWHQREQLLARISEMEDALSAIREMIKEGL